MTDNLCVICNKPKGRNKFACSHKCYSALRQHMKICVVCGALFPDPPSNATKTCSSECSIEHRKRLAAAGVNEAALAAAHRAIPLRPLTGRYETHVNAKTWVIQAPDGEVYRCRNLKLWLINHAEMLDGTVSQAMDGFVKMKQTMLGKARRPLSQWKGWRLLEWSDD